MSHSCSLPLRSGMFLESSACLALLYSEQRLLQLPLLGLFYILHIVSRIIWEITSFVALKCSWFDLQSFLWIGASCPISLLGSPGHYLLASIRNSLSDQPHSRRILTRIKRDLLSRLSWLMLRNHWRIFGFQKEAESYQIHPRDALLGYNWVIFQNR